MYSKPDQWQSDRKRSRDDYHSGYPYANPSGAGYYEQGSGNGPDYDQKRYRPLPPSFPPTSREPSTMYAGSDYGNSAYYQNNYRGGEYPRMDAYTSPGFHRPNEGFGAYKDYNGMPPGSSLGGYGSYRSASSSSSSYPNYNSAPMSSYSPDAYRYDRGTSNFGPAGYYDNRGQSSPSWMGNNSGAGRYDQSTFPYQQAGRDTLNDRLSFGGGGSSYSGGGSPRPPRLSVPQGSSGNSGSPRENYPSGSYSNPSIPRNPPVSRSYSSPVPSGQYNYSGYNGSYDNRGSGGYGSPRSFGGDSERHQQLVSGSSSSNGNTSGASRYYAGATPVPTLYPPSSSYQGYNYNSNGYASVGNAGSVSNLPNSSNSTGGNASKYSSTSWNRFGDLGARMNNIRDRVDRNNRTRQLLSKNASSSGSASNPSSPSKSSQVSSATNNISQKSSISSDQQQAQMPMENRTMVDMEIDDVKESTTVTAEEDSKRERVLQDEEVIAMVSEYKKYMTYRTLRYLVDLDLYPGCKTARVETATLLSNKVIG